CDHPRGRQDRCRHDFRRLAYSLCSSARCRLGPRVSRGL
ncbi:uncharacterized protein METZ01_LOCUS196339, partial [marine metagenome]